MPSSRKPRWGEAEAARAARTPAPEERSQATGKADKAGAAYDANPPRGERGDFIGTRLTFPPPMLEAVRLEGIRRQRDGARHTTVSELVREAVEQWLARLSPK